MARKKIEIMSLITEETKKIRYTKQYNDFMQLFATTRNALRKGQHVKEITKEMQEKYLNYVLVSAKEMGDVEEDSDEE